MDLHFGEQQESTSLKELHFKEDTSKPENRVNLSLFHLLMNREVKSFIFSKLQLDPDCVIYPAPNLVTEEFDTIDRPDFKIEKNGQLVGYIEVELGKDDVQVEKYKNKTADHIVVYSIFGKISDGGDLSLEEIYYHLREKQDDLSRNSQDYWSLKLLLKLIQYYVIDGNFKSNNKRTSISISMRDSLIIMALYKNIGANYILDQPGCTPQNGRLLLNTVGESGFSVRVYSRKSSNGSFSLMNRTGGTDKIYFPAYVKMKLYISDIEFIERYTNFLISLGCRDIKAINERQQVSLPIKTVEDNMEELSNCIKLLMF